MSQIVRDGSPVNVCDGCGGDVGNASMLDAVTVHAMDAGGQPITLHAGTRCCAPKILTGAGLRWRQSAPDSPGAVAFYKPAGDEGASGRGRKRAARSGSGTDGGGSGSRRSRSRPRDPGANTP